ncbi:MAG: hypothetical protein DHS20C20_24760 [Ardenticatenaceae bacterium]|nr:MAG: hypothetical protein DHS20C20_24760 [Ardenticatenaceae bacterium]
MKKAILLLLLASLLACGPGTTDTQPANTDAEEETAVSTTEETAETNDDTPSQPLVLLPKNFDDFSPASTVEEAAVIREQDWQKGAADPVVVIIEYGDFQ